MLGCDIVFLFYAKLATHYACNLGKKMYPAVGEDSWSWMEYIACCMQSVNH